MSRKVGHSSRWKIARGRRVCVMKGEPTGKIDLTEQKDLAGNQLEFREQKEESLPLLEAGEGHLGCQVVMKAYNQKERERETN